MGARSRRSLFIAVPRSIWPNKPKSMVDIYTSRWNPAWRRTGCSTGINVYAEYFWNFHVFGVLCVMLIFYLLNRVFFFYLSMLRTGNVWPFIYLGVGYSSLLMYARGHGLDGLAVHVIVAMLFSGCSSIRFSQFQVWESGRMFIREKEHHRLSVTFQSRMSSMWSVSVREPLTAPCPVLSFWTSPRLPIPRSL